MMKSVSDRAVVMLPARCALIGLFGMSDWRPGTVARRVDISTDKEVCGQRFARIVIIGLGVRKQVVVVVVVGQRNAAFVFAIFERSNRTNLRMRDLPELSVLPRQNSVCAQRSICINECASFIVAGFGHKRIYVRKGRRDSAQVAPFPFCRHGADRSDTPNTAVVAS